MDHFFLIISAWKSENYVQPIIYKSVCYDWSENDLWISAPELLKCYKYALILMFIYINLLVQPSLRHLQEKSLRFAAFLCFPSFFSNYYTDVRRLRLDSCLC